MSFFVEGCLQALRLASSESFAVGGESCEEGNQHRHSELLVWGVFKLKDEGKLYKGCLSFVLSTKDLDFGERDTVAAVAKAIDESQSSKGLGYEGLRTRVLSSIARCGGGWLVCAGGNEKQAEEGKGVFHEFKVGERRPNCNEMCACTLVSVLGRTLPSPQRLSPLYLKKVLLHFSHALRMDPRTHQPLEDALA